MGTHQFQLPSIPAVHLAVRVPQLIVQLDGLAALPQPDVHGIVGIGREQGLAALSKAGCCSVTIDTVRSPGETRLTCPGRC